METKTFITYRLQLSTKYAKNSISGNLKWNMFKYYNMFLFEVLYLKSISSFPKYWLTYGWVDSGFVLNYIWKWTIAYKLKEWSSKCKKTHLKKNELYGSSTLFPGIVWSGFRFPIEDDFKIVFLFSFNTLPLIFAFSYFFQKNKIIWGFKVRNDRKSFWNGCLSFLGSF